MENNLKQEMLCHSTPRLDAIFNLLSPFSSIADIGCDHAYLSLMLARAGKNVVCSDINEGPVMRAKKNIEKFGFEDRISLRMGDGLKTLASGECDAAVIAGMGGDVIEKIILGEMKIAKELTLFLQPMSKSQQLRKFLYESGFEIRSETLVKEERRIYTIMQVKSGNAKTFEKIDTYFSDALVLCGDPLFEEYFLKNYKNLIKVIESVKKSRNDALLKDFESLKEDFEKLGGRYL